MDIQTKICPRCKIEKSVECYSKNKNSKDGLHSYCKDCKNHHNKQYRQENLEKERERHKKYYQENLEKVREHRQENAEKKREYSKLYHQKNLEKVRERQKKYYQENLEKERERNKQYRQENNEKIRERQKKYYQENLEKERERHKKYDQKRLKTDPKFKLDKNMSRSIHKCLKSKGLSKKETGWQKAVGYTVEQLKEHLEKQFDDKMTWENQGTYWHIDHIKPKSLFEYDSIDHPEFKKCWSLDNLQPLEAIENLKKSNKYSEEGE
jgi:hypothetical protein